MLRRWRGVWRQPLTPNPDLGRRRTRFARPRRTILLPRPTAPAGCEVLPDLTVPAILMCFSGRRYRFRSPAPGGKPIPGIAPAPPSSRDASVAETIKARLRGGTPGAFQLQARRQPGADRQRKAVIVFESHQAAWRHRLWIWGIAHIYLLIGLRNKLQRCDHGLWSTPGISAPRG